MSRLYIKEVEFCDECPALKSNIYLGKAYTYCLIHEDSMRIKELKKIHKDCPLEEVKC